MLSFFVILKTYSLRTYFKSKIPNKYKIVYNLECDLPLLEALNIVHLSSPTIHPMTVTSFSLPLIWCLGGYLRYFSNWFGPRNKNLHWILLNVWPEAQLWPIGLQKDKGSLWFCWIGIRMTLRHASIISFQLQITMERKLEYKPPNKRYHDRLQKIDPKSWHIYIFCTLLVVDTRLWLRALLSMPGNSKGCIYYLPSKTAYFLVQRVKLEPPVYETTFLVAGARDPKIN